jgi:hypothetical protein
MNGGINDLTENLYDHWILFWYCKFIFKNENMSIFQPYVKLIITNNVEQWGAQVLLSINWKISKCWYIYFWNILVLKSLNTNDNQSC